MRRVVLIAGLLFVAPPAAPARAAHGDDWQIKRSGNDPRAQAQLEAALLRAPDDAKLLARLDGTSGHAALDQKWAAKFAAHPTAATALIAGELLARHGKLDDAVARLADAVRLASAGDDALAARAHFALAKVHLARNQMSAAHAEAELAEKTAPASLRHDVLLFLAAQATQPFDRTPATARAEAVAVFGALIREAPRDATLRRQYGEALAVLGAPAEAAAAWRDAAPLERNPLDRVTDERHAAELLAQAGQPDAALALLQHASTELPRGHVLRREVLEAIVDVQRQRDGLVEQAATWDQAWPAGQRDFVEWEALARVFDEIGRPERAIAAYTSALTKDPHAIEARRRLITLLERAGRNDDALAQWRRLVESAPGEPRYQLDLAERLARSGQKEAAERLMAKVGASSRSTAIAAQLTDLYEKLGLHEHAIAQAEKLVQLDPSDGSRLVTLGELYLQKGQRERALATWRRLADAGPAGVVRLGDVYAEHDMTEDALTQYQRASEALPKDRALRAKLADALAQAGRNEAAIGAYEALLDDAAVNDDRASAARARQRLVTLLRANSNLTLGRDALRWALLPDERQKLQHGLLLVDMDRALGRLDDAATHLAQLERAIKDPLLRADLAVAVADVERGRQHLDAAIAALDRATALDPTRARALAGLQAELLLARYRDKDALLYVQKAAQAAPDDPDLAVRLGDVYARRNELAAARAAYEHALALDNQRWRLYFTVAELDLRLGDYAACAAVYRRVIRGAPDEEQVVDAVHRDLDVEEYLGTLDALEHELWPRSYAHPEVTAYVDLLVDLYRRQGSPLLAAARAGDAAARAKLARIGGHALAPLLDALATAQILPAVGGVAGNEAAITTAQLLGELGNAAAAAQLLKIAIAQAPSPKDNASDPPTIALRMTAALAGAQLATPSERPLLLALSRSSEKYLRAAALFGLGRLPTAPPG